MRQARGTPRTKLDNLFWNVIDTPKLVAKLIKIVCRVIQYEHACGPDRANNMLPRIKSANEHHGRLAASVKAGDFMKGNKKDCLVGKIVRVRYEKAIRQIAVLYPIRKKR